MCNYELWSRNVAALLLRKLQGESSIKPSLCPNYSFLSPLDPAEGISGIPHLPPHPDIQTFCLGASGGPTQEAKAHPLTLSKQREETGPEGAETVWEKENKCEETDADTSAQTRALSPRARWRGWIGVSQ